MEELKNSIKTIEYLILSCNKDYELLKNEDINRDWFDNYDNQRIVNSFLFNFIKIQDKMGGKLFKSLLYALKEIDDFSLPMLDVLHIMEKLKIIKDCSEWEKLREIRNAITHEYPFDVEERIDNINLTINGYMILSELFKNIKYYLNTKITI